MQIRYFKFALYYEEKLIIEEDLSEGNIKLLSFVEAIGKLQARKHSKFFA